MREKLTLSTNGLFGYDLSLKAVRGRNKGSCRPYYGIFSSVSFRPYPSAYGGLKQRQPRELDLIIDSCWQGLRAEKSLELRLWLHQLPYVVYCGVSQSLSIIESSLCCLLGVLLGHKRSHHSLERPNPRRIIRLLCHKLYGTTCFGTQLFASSSRASLSIFRPGCNVTAEPAQLLQLQRSCLYQRVIER